MKMIILCLGILASPLASAGVTAYSGVSGEKLYVESAPALGKEVYLMKMDGFNSPWNGKIFQVKRALGASGDERFSFDYELELSNGVQKKTYGVFTENGFELVEGSRVKKVEIFYEGMPDHRHGLQMNQDRKLTETSQKIDLAAQFKKTPYKPEVD